jgi:hypothetical protein
MDKVDNMSTERHSQEYQIKEATEEGCCCEVYLRRSDSRDEEE